MYFENSKLLWKYVFIIWFLEIDYNLYKKWLHHDYKNVMKSIKMVSNLKQKRQKNKKHGKTKN